MSRQRQVVMESSLAVGRLELNPCSAAVSVNLAQRLSGGPPALDKCGQRAQGPQGPQGQTHLNGCVPLSHQVAGHKYGVDKVGILQHPDGTVLKQLQPPPRGPRELQFYNMVYADDCSNPCLLELQDHLPKYYGTWSSPDSPQDLYLKLEDVTRRFVKPCIMDVKLGQRSYDPYASQEKREQQIRKYPLMEEIGFLVLGMRVFKVCSDTFDIYDQHFGRGLVKDTIKEGLAKFFHNGVTLRKDAVSASICRVQQILQWFESQQQLTFYASSLLFVYEGLPSFSSLSPFSSPINIHSFSPTEGKIAMVSSVRDCGRDGEGKITQEREKQEENMEECNNNSSNQMSAPWDYSLGRIYNRHIKGDLHRCPKANVHDTSGDGVEVTVSSVSRDNNSVSHKEGKACKQKGESQQPPNGNRNISQVEKNQGRAREEDKLKRLVGDPTEGQSAEPEVEVRMIDFAHVFQSDSHDHGYIYGLKHLLSVLEQILRNTS